MLQSQELFFSDEDEPQLAKKKEQNAICQFIDHIHKQEDQLKPLTVVQNKRGRKRVDKPKAPRGRPRKYPLRLLRPSPNNHSSQSIKSISTYNQFGEQEEEFSIFDSNQSIYPEKTMKGEINKIIKHQNEQSNQDQNEQTSINTDELYEMFFCDFQQLKKMQNEPDLRQHTFHNFVINDIINELIYKRELLKSIYSYTKARNFVVRRILDDYVNSNKHCDKKQEAHLNKNSRRLTNIDRERYLLLGLVIPPSRISSNYIEQIFENDGFRRYCVDYIKYSKLRQALLKVNENEVTIFCQETAKMASNNISLAQKKEAFKKLKKPSSLNEIQYYEKQAEKIFNFYYRERR